MNPEPFQFSWENPGIARRSVTQQLFEDASHCKSNAHKNINEIKTLKCYLFKKYTSINCLEINTIQKVSQLYVSSKF